MSAALLSHWRSKAISLVLAIAIWYLIDMNLRRPERLQIPVPGTVNPMPDTSPNSILPIPGGGSPGTGIFPPTSLLRVESREIHLARLHWLEVDGFSASVRIFPDTALPLSA